jgi:hypothetical protein
MAKRDSRVPKTGPKKYKVLPQHQSLAGPSVNRIDVPRGLTSNTQFHTSRGKFGVNDHRIARATPTFSPVED